MKPVLVLVDLFGFPSEVLAKRSHLPIFPTPPRKLPSIVIPEIVYNRLMDTQSSRRLFYSFWPWYGLGWSCALIA